MNEITFDKTAKKFVWEIFNGLAVNRRCPFCDDWVNLRNFVGAIHFNGEPRVFDGKITCLIALAAYTKGQEKTDA